MIWNLSEITDESKSLYIGSLLASLSREGFSESDLTRLKVFLENENDFGSNWFDKFKNEHIGMNLDALIDHLSKLHVENSSCYLRGDPERTRVIQWPNNSNTKLNEPDHYFDIFEDLPFRRTFNFIDKTTPIGSLGSCFALRIAHELQLSGYNYIIEEDDLPQGFDLSALRETSYRMAPARVGTLFTLPSMRQVIERGLGLWEPEKKVIFDDKRIIDPFRAAKAQYSDLKGYEVDFKKHTEALRRALLKCEVMVLTLGLTEAWYFAHSGEYTSLSPWKVDPLLLRKKNLTVEENLNELERIFSVYKKFKPSIKFIISVSPVPLNKTFEPDMHIVEANCLSKSTLRVAATVFAKRHPESVFYFPSFEVVTYCTKVPWEQDMRHVSQDAVKRVMELFGKMFLKENQKLEMKPWQIRSNKKSFKQKVKSKLISAINRV